MAIKVNGTSVINDSRQLQNIASVDSATVTALSNAGVGGGENTATWQTFSSSGSYIVPKAANLVCAAIGGGGSGCFVRSGVANAGTAHATGGSAGGMAIKLFSNVSAGTTISFTVGAGGASIMGNRANNASQVATGAAGGTTSLTISGTTISGSGGGGGNGGTNTSTRTSNAGGSGSGGDLNVTGGTSSTSYVTAVTSPNSTNRKAASGAPVGIGTTVASKQPTIGEGNFAYPANTFHVQYSNTNLQEMIEQIYGNAYDLGSRADVAGTLFGVPSSGGWGHTDYGAYTFKSFSFPGNNGGGGGGMAYGHGQVANYTIPDNADSQDARSGAGGDGLVLIGTLLDFGDL